MDSITFCLKSENVTLFMVACTNIPEFCTSQWYFWKAVFSVMLDSVFLIKSKSSNCAFSFACSVILYWITKLIFCGTVSMTSKYCPLLEKYNLAFRMQRISAWHMIISKIFWATENFGIWALKQGTIMQGFFCKSYNEFYM